MAGQPVTTGTVAARVQAFQEILRGDHPCTVSPSPHIIAPPYESGITVGQGNRVDPVFALPACRASRDGTEGSRGNGRPPVGKPKVDIYPFALGADGLYERPILRPAQQRPATSFDVNRSNSTKSFGSPRPSFSEHALHSHRSTDKNAHNQSAGEELVSIRNRLRSVKSSKSTEIPTCQEPSNNVAYLRRSEATQSVLEELDDMLDDAIGENGGQSHEVAEQPRTSLRISPESHEQFHGRPTTATTATATATETLSLSKPRSSAQAASPVKQRAAMFETMQRWTSDENVSTTNVHTCTRHDVLKCVRSPVLESELSTTNDAAVAPEVADHRAYRPPEQVNHAKNNGEEDGGTEDVVPPAVHEPPISLTLPQLLGPRPCHSRNTADSSSDSFGTAPLPDIGEHIDFADRKASPNWPFKWNLFSTRKAFPAAIQHGDFDGKAGEHTPPMQTTNVRSRIQSLLNASGQTELPLGVFQERPGPEIRRGSIHEKEVVVLGTQSMSPTLIGSEPAGLSGMPFHAEVIASAKSPTPPRRLSADTIEDIKRAVPETPPRGRARTVETSLSPSKRKNTYSNESRFALGRSGSRGGIRIEVEIQSPRSSPRRDGAVEEQVIIVRANIDPVEEEGESADFRKLG